MDLLKPQTCTSAAYLNELKRRWRSGTTPDQLHKGQETLRKSQLGEELHALWLVEEISGSESRYSATAWRVKVSWGSW